MNKRRMGTEYEQLAAAFLKKSGYSILETNFRCSLGEIDIIARQGGYLVFIEVKYRKNNTCGDGESAVDTRKQVRISRTAAYYLIKKRYSESTPCRFDVVAIDGTNLHLYKNAFEYIDG